MPQQPKPFLPQQPNPMGNIPKPQPKWLTIKLSLNNYF
jgi:hypothetical protein